MPILRPFLTPTAQPTPVAIKRNMAQQGFYEPQQSQEQFTNPPVTGDYIIKQLQKYAQRKSPPLLQPGSRVTLPNRQLVEPGNFQKFYEMLGTINQSGNEMLGAAQAKSAYQRLQQLQSVSSQQVQPFNLPQLQTGGSGRIGSAALGSIPSNPAANFRFAQSVAPNYGWGPDELKAWYTLGMKESGWNNNAQNPTSTAYGIGQFLNSTWAGVGIGKTNDPATQVEAMARYIRNRYGSPSRALAFHIKNNWY